MAFDNIYIDISREHVNIYIDPQGNYVNIYIDISSFFGLDFGVSWQSTRMPGGALAYGDIQTAGKASPIESYRDSGGKPDSLSVKERSRSPSS